MGRVNMYVPGKALKKTDDVAKAIVKGQWLYYNGVPKHPRFMSSMQLKAIYNGCKAGAIKVARKNPQYRG